MSVATVSPPLHPARRVMRYQALAAIAVSALAAIFASPRAAIAAGYGGAVALVLAWQLARGLGAALVHDGNAMRRAIYSGVLQRLLFAGAALGLGLGALRLVPAPLLGAFSLCQAAYLFCGAR